MLTEEVVISRGGDNEVKVYAHQLIVPDIRVLSLCLDEETGMLLMFCYRNAMKLHGRIKTRKPKDRAGRVEKGFRYDVPDLWPTAKLFQRCDGEIVMSFWLVYHGLIQHFMPGVEGATYTYGDNVIGLRYEGRGWYTEVNKEGKQ